MSDFKRVTGVGGIFFKSKNPSETRDWYKNHLGFVTNEYGSLFEFREGANPDKVGYTQWSPFKDDTEYFQPSEKEFMLNFRVADMDKLIPALKAEGIQIIGEVQEFEYGKFAHIMDLDGNKIELWEPIDQVFTDMYKDETTK